MGQNLGAIGRVYGAPPFFGLMDVHVLRSLREGFPNVLVDASAMAIPTVTTDPTGAIDGVRDGETGIIVKTNHARGLAGALEKLPRDPTVSSRHGQAARSWATADFQHRSVVRTKLALCECATNDLQGLELGAGRMTGGV